MARTTKNQRAAKQTSEKALAEKRKKLLDALAVSVRKALETNPTLTVNLLASQLDATVQDVHQVLDEYLCTEDSIVCNGPGQGGGWVSQPEPEPIGTHAGYRHPDGELHDKPWEA